MNEDKRKKIINDINKGISDKESLLGKYERVKQIQKNPIVIEYLQLKSDIKEIENDIKSYQDLYGIVDDSIDKRIARGFRINRHHSACDHPIWIYHDSYYDFFGNLIPLNDEDVKRFSARLSCNEYICLECNKVVQIVDWEKFESMNFVLRDGDNTPNIVDYQNLYYNLLYRFSDSSYVKERVADEFYKNKENKHKLRKKK